MTTQQAPQPVGGKGKVAKSAKGAAKRFRKPNSYNEISKPGLRRLSRRAGATRISGAALKLSRELLIYMLKNVLYYSRIYCSYSKRKTVNVVDVVYALRKIRITYVSCSLA
ncbi:H4 [Hepatospora eriocheir]|uniref:H4 n=1 Tax=Hepatospora eriocheir TaxID=1081669 RepID=A0A1X0QEC5_9MICR|nr:H4 [Hepatospora eriocheir]ORD99348.1 H4 [Hepatospora eriocheir]